jgi:hypothetical protein
MKAEHTTDALTPAELTAQVVLKDGRLFRSHASVLAPRPRVRLISKGVQSDDDAASPVRLGSGNDLPVDGRVVFFVKAVTPPFFSRAAKIEVAAVDQSFGTVLGIADGNLILQDRETAVAILDPQKQLGASAFGMLRFRPIDASGTTGEWQPLGTLVRLPALKELQCTTSVPKECLLVGDNLFLLTAVASDEDFAHAEFVPDGFTGQKLQLPHLSGSSLYFKLRDDPAVVQTVTLPITHGTHTISPSANLREKPEN